MKTQPRTQGKNVDFEIVEEHWNEYEVDGGSVERLCCVTPELLLNGS